MTRTHVMLIVTQRKTAVIIARPTGWDCCEDTLYAAQDVATYLFFIPLVLSLSYKITILSTVQYCVRPGGRDTILARRMVVPTGILFLASVSPCLDITQEIKIDHDNVRDLFSRFKQSTDAKDETLIANTLIREMSVHGNAGEVSVYNDYSPLGLDDAVKHNKGEHATVKKLVRKAEHAPASMKNYDVILAEAAEAFLQHASEGEAEQFPKLLEKVTPE